MPHRVLLTIPHTRRQTMLDTLLPDDFDTIEPGDLEDAARQSAKAGDFPQAAAILATGYKAGGPPVFLEQAYTYLHYLANSRRMLRRGARSLQWEHGGAITDYFAARYSDEFLDCLIDRFDTLLNEQIGAEREPSGAILLLAETKLADGLPTDEVLAQLPRSEKIATRAKLVAARCPLANGDRAKAEHLLREIATQSENAASAMNMLGAMAWETGKGWEAATWYEISLHTAFAPAQQQDIPADQIRFMTTIMKEFDIYAYSDGFFVVRKQPALVGVVIFGRQIMEVMRSPGYSQWSTIKRIIGRYVDIDWIKAHVVLANDDKGPTTSGRKDAVLRAVYRVYDRTMLRIGAGPIRPFLKKTGFAVFWLLSPLLIVSGWLVSAISWLLRPLRRLARSSVAAGYRFLLLSWLKAREVPPAQKTADVHDIFKVISRMIDEQERAVSERARE